MNRSSLIQGEASALVDGTMFGPPLFQKLGYKLSAPIRKASETQSNRDTSRARGKVGESHRKDKAARRQTPTMDGRYGCAAVGSGNVGMTCPQAETA